MNRLNSQSVLTYRVYEKPAQMWTNYRLKYRLKVRRMPILATLKSEWRRWGLEDHAESAGAIMQ